jgi:hypothetical protein
MELVTNCEFVCHFTFFFLPKSVISPVQRAENTAVGIRHVDHMAFSNPQKLALTSPTSGGLSVGIVRSRTQAREFTLV